MNRRDFLATAALAAVGLAGCSDGSTRAPPDGQTPTMSAGATDGATATGGTDTPTAAPADLAFSGEVVRQPSGDAPGLVRARLTNPTNAPATVRYGSSLLLSGESSPSGLSFPAGIALLPDATDESLDRGQGCWRVPRPAPTRTSWSYRPPVQIPAGEGVADEYLVATAPRADGCPPAGEYRFENEVVQGGYDGPTVALTVTVASAGRLSVDAAGPASGA